ncbi:helix-turn-helix domain-containing protein [Arthrobacter globiformis]|uniref:helix-turn-helix domain-containing protein n=1 Tax=Arthrobacter globiformis TaxID=1665 RepID=UPI00277D355B|nr:helix-turn-helix domain-containing protein [Arthrobacter globiformis]MDQ0865710.1 hypothetical protein [Arthrobacter globiformis]
MNDDDVWLTVPELAALLKLSPAAVYARLPIWPHHDPTGSDIRFTREDIEAIKELTQRRPAPVTNNVRRVPSVGTRANRARRTGQGSPR